MNSPATRHILITGANRGIGLALATYYSNQGDTVHAVCRQRSEELTTLGANIIDGIDVGDSASIANMCAQLGDQALDIVINNAGILRDEALPNINAPQIEQQFRINALAPLMISEALLANMQAGSKLALITSRMGSIADNGSGGRYGYRMSKAALNAAGKSLSIDLQPKGIAVAILHPGYVQTEMVNFGGDISANSCAQRLAQRIDELTINTTGSFWHSNGEILPW